MALTINEILKFKYPKADFSRDIILSTDNNGNMYVQQWNMPGIPQPTNAQILAYVTDQDYLTNLAIYNRVYAADGYGTVADQLDMIYKDLRDGTQNFQQKIGTIKDTLYPKPPATSKAPPNVTPIVVVKKNSPSAAYKELVLVNSSSAQSISGTAKVDVAFTTKISDPNNVFNANSYTALTGGVYEVNCFFEVANFAILSLVAAYRWDMFITQGGSVAQSVLVDTYTHAALAATGSSLRGQNMMYLAAGDTIKIQVQKGNATALNISNARLNVKKISEI